ncbi:MAG: hypothetical protein KH704_03995 [Clostridiales bacterium]|nr:hypothetical protein [Clostridiales bacterium]
MNMKDAFRFQNRIKSLMCEATSILQDRRNIVKVKTTHLRSQVLADTQDAVVEEAAPSEYAGHANEVTALLMFLMDEREKLSQAIHAAKSNLELDMDSEVGLNRQRQELAEVFRRMAALRNSERTIAGGGSGFRFNGEGNQVSYRCDATQVTTIDFDRNKIRGMAAALSKKADEISVSLDRCLVNTEVTYEMPFDMNDSFEEILNDFIEKAAVS